MQTSPIVSGRPVMSISTNPWRRRFIYLAAIGIGLALVLSLWLAQSHNRSAVRAFFVDGFNRIAGEQQDADRLARYFGTIKDNPNLAPAGLAPGLVAAAGAVTDTVTNTVSAPGASVLGAGPLRVASANPRYFADGTGKLVYLTGAHYWLNFQDGVFTDPPPAFDYTKYLDFLQSQNHNFFRLWNWEQGKWVVEWPSAYYFAPLPYQRTGPGTALDGKPKYNLDQFNQAYFDRMRARIVEAGQRGMYVSVMLFNGWSVMKEQYPSLANPWEGHPFNAANNVNGVDGDVNHDDSGSDTHTLANQRVTDYQEAFVRKVIDTVGDLDNVLYEVSNESPDNSIAWQYHMIDYIKAYEATKPKQHPVGMTGRYEWPLSDLLDSHADWISPGGGAFQWDPQANDGQKVIINDTDHLWGIGGDRVWVWKSFTPRAEPDLHGPVRRQLQAGGRRVRHEQSHRRQPACQPGLHAAVCRAHEPGSHDAAQRPVFDQLLPGQPLCQRRRVHRLPAQQRLVHGQAGRRQRSYGRGVDGSQERRQDGRQCRQRRRHAHLHAALQR